MKLTTYRFTAHLTAREVMRYRIITRIVERQIGATYRNGWKTFLSIYGTSGAAEQFHQAVGVSFYKGLHS